MFFLPSCVCAACQLVVERSHMSAEFFNLYLHQNYLDFFSEVEDVARASEYLSDADFFTGDWAVHLPNTRSKNAPFSSRWLNVWGVI